MAVRVSSLNRDLSKHTSFFGIRLWVLIVALVSFFTVVIIIMTFLCIIYFCRQKSKSTIKPHFRLVNPIPCTNYRSAFRSSSLDRRLLSHRITEIEMSIAKMDHIQPSGMSPYGGSNVNDLEFTGRYSPMISAACRGHKFSLRDIELATNGFSDENVIGDGDHGVVYDGVLLDTTRVAVKKVLNSSCQLKDFAAQVEQMEHVRHKNLVKLIGYCAEGNYRMLLNEYVDNGNLHQWLHGCPESISPLTWDLRVNMIQGIAKGLAYLHEDIEPKIVHQDLKSTNVLLDHQWNPKISDFAISKLLGSDYNREISSAMGKFGYLAQQHAATGIQNEKSDVYSFGILVMEIITGRTPVDHHQPQPHLIDWLKSMVTSQKTMYVVDPKLPEMPSSKELKRMLLLSLRCCDTDIKHRPTMEKVIHMLEPRDLLLNDEPAIRRDPFSRGSHAKEGHTVVRLVEDEFKKQGTETESNLYEKMIPK